MSENMRGSLISAGAALGGSIVGGVVSVVLLAQQFDHESDVRSEERTEKVYVDFFSEAVRLENQIRYEGSSVNSEEFSELLSRVSAVEMFGSADAHLQALSMFNGLTQVADNAPVRNSDESWDKYDAAEKTFLNEMQAALGVENSEF